jgi:hypothetical protein
LLEKLACGEVLFSGYAAGGKYNAGEGEERAGAA